MSAIARLTLAAIALACATASAQTGKGIDPRHPDPAAIERQLKAGAKPAPASDAKASRGQERWNDNYTNKVVSTGVEKAYPNHDTDIPGDVIASKMGSESAAMAMWGSQGAKKVDYTGCGACDVGSTIKVVVDFGYIVDTHEYVRVR